MYKALVALILLFNVNGALAHFHISASNTPIASIVSLIVKDKAYVTSICNVNNGCAHHYSVKPNQVSEVQSADIVVYIDDGFETFVPKLLSANKKQLILKLSDIELVIKKDNWHVWLCTENIRRIAGFILLNLVKFDSANTNFYSQNYQDVLKMVDNLEQKLSGLKSLKDPLLLDSSLEYFFSNFSTDVTKFYSSAEHMMKPQDLQNLEEFVKTRHPKCIFISSKQDAGKLSEYLKNQTRIISLESESWETSAPYDRVLEQKMINMIALVSSCL